MVSDAPPTIPISQRGHTMVAPRDWLKRTAGDAGDLRGALDAIREKHGKGATSFLAGLCGVSKGTAARWLSGKQSPNPRVPGRVDAIRKAGDRIAAARKIRRMRTVRPRMVAVEELSPATAGPGGFRQIDSDINLGVMSDRIAEAWERGDEAEAAKLLDQALIAGYAGEDVTDDTGLAALLSISDFMVEPDVTWE